MRYVSALTLAVAAATVAAQNATIIVETIGNTTTHVASNATINVPLGQVYADPALDAVSGLYLMAAGGADIDAIRCTPHLNANGTGDAGTSFAYNSPITFPNGTVDVGSLFCSVNSSRADLTSSTGSSGPVSANTAATTTSTTPSSSSHDVASSANTTTPPASSIQSVVSSAPRSSAATTSSPSSALSSQYSTTLVPATITTEVVMTVVPVCVNCSTGSPAEMSTYTSVVIVTATPTPMPSPTLIGSPRLAVNAAPDSVPGAKLAAVVGMLGLALLVM